MKFPTLLLVFVTASLTVATSSTVLAHMPWLATDPQGHVIMWFGETPDDRMYPMPKTVAGIELNNGESGIAVAPVENKSLVGIRGLNPVAASGEISGIVTYGLYHGTKLTYHVEHLPQTETNQWPSEPRADAALQSVITASPSGGVNVMILRNGKPAKDLDVKLFCEDGHEEASATTDIAGIVTFKKSSVEPGLNGIVVGVKDEAATGTFEGENYGSNTDYLTATFLIPAVHSPESKPNPKPSRPEMDAQEGAMIVPANLPDLPEELTSFGATIANEKLFVYGGHTGNAHSYSTDEQSNRLWCLDLSLAKEGTWQNLPGGPALQGLALVAHGGRVVRIGGFTAMNETGEDQDLRSQDSVASFNPTTGAWTDLPSLPEPRSSLDAAILDDTVYVFGGWKLSGESDEAQWHSTAWSLDLSTASSSNGAWQSIATPPTQRRAISVAAYQRKLYVIGGMTSAGKPTTKVEVYDPKTDSWSEGPSLPGSGMSGFGSASFATGGNLYVSTMDGFVYRLSEDQDSWTSIGKVEPARFFHRMLPVSESEMLIIGGANMEMGKFTQIDRIELR